MSRHFWLHRNPFNMKVGRSRWHNYCQGAEWIICYPESPLKTVLITLIWHPVRKEASLVMIHKGFLYQSQAFQRKIEKLFRCICQLEVNTCHEKQRFKYFSMYWIYLGLFSLSVGCAWLINYPHGIRGTHICNCIQASPTPDLNRAVKMRAGMIYRIC